MSTLERLSPLLIAPVMTAAVAGWYIGPVAGQLDFWLIWLLSLLVVSLPLLLLELGLQRRQPAGAGTGLPVLTREADAPTYWRALAPLGWLITLLLASGLIAQGWQALQHLPLIQQGLTGALSWAGLLTVLLIVIGASLLRASWLLAAALLLMLVTYGSQLLQYCLPHWQTTPVTLGEWSQAVALSLLSAGIGFGLYWQRLVPSPFSSGTDIALLAKRHTGLLLVLAAAGTALVLLVQGQTVEIRPALFWLGQAVLAWLVAAFLLQKASAQWQPGTRWLSALVAGLLLLVWHWSAGHARLVLLGLALLTALGYAIFAGWRMKISHLRKALNLPSEGLYNLWRILIRLLVPALLLLALIGLFTGNLSGLTSQVKTPVAAVTAPQSVAR